MRATLLLTTLLVMHLVKAQDFYDNKHTSEKNNIPYLISLPEGYEEKSEAYPLLLFLHGGDRSNTKHHPKKYAAGQGINLDFLVAAPHCSGGCSWSRVDFEALVNEIAKDYRIDKNRIYITGYSMGGYGTWNALMNYPDLFAAAAPICGGGNPSKICDAKSVTIKAFHAQDDNVTPYSGSEKMIKALEACGGKAELKSSKTGGHGIWPAIFKDADFYDWMLAQSK